MRGAQRFRFSVLALATIIVVAVAIFWRSPPPAGSDLPSPSPATPAPTSNGEGPLVSEAVSSRTNASPPVEPAAAVAIRIENAHAHLLALDAGNASLEERTSVVGALRAELLAASQSSSAEAIALFLESGRDAPTGLAFAPGPHGFLDSAPKLRSLLLDLLEQVDPASAREAAQDVFTDTAPVADEWSLALRITAHGTSPDVSEVSNEFVQRVRELLSNSTWLAQPSAGFLHGFDAAVHSGNAALVDELATLATGAGHEAVQFAARLALDRMAMADFATTAGRLIANPALLVDAPHFRGQLLARADVSESAARATLEGFLTDPRSSPDSLQAWAEFFPHRSKHLSNNLLTSDHPASLAELARMDRAALSTVRDWRASSALKAVDSLLAKVQARLEQYVASADRGEAARARTSP